jgi:hypothetical protein
MNKPLDSLSEPPDQLDSLKKPSDTLCKPPGQLDSLKRPLCIPDDSMPPGPGLLREPFLWLDYCKSTDSMSQLSRLPDSWYHLSAL